MPIRPSERAKYPKDWKAIAARIRERAGNRCECRGECGDSHTEATLTCAHRPRTRCGAPNGALIIRDIDAPARFSVHTVCGGCVGGDPDCARAVRVVLTVAHLDHDPAHNDESNLLACCQRCHNRIDIDHRKRTRAATLRARKANAELFE